MAHLRSVLAVVLIVVLSLPAWSAADAVNTAFDGLEIDLMPSLKSVETERPVVAIELPGVDGAPAATMTLEAKGGESTHRWAIVTLANHSADIHDLVIATPQQGFVGSGMLWPRQSGSRIQNVAFVGEAAVAPLQAVNADAVSIHLPPNSSVTVALELTRAGLSELGLWKRDAFDQRGEQYGFYRGVLIGIAVLLGVIALSLYAVRASAVFPSVAVFIWASVAFIGLESGYLPLLDDVVPAELRPEAQARAAVEGLMLTGLLLSLVAFGDLRKHWRVMGNLLLFIAAVTLVIPLYGLFEPAKASAIARICFSLVAIGGLGVIVAQWQDGIHRARVSLLAWTMVVAWTLYAAIVVLVPIDEGMMRLILISGLVLVLLTFAFTLAQFAFGQGFLAQRLLAEDARRALALAASQQFVWDWQVEDRVLHVGEEIEKFLGLRKASVANGGLDAWLSLIHPADRAAYLASVEEAERRGQGSFFQEFRLRRGDGEYRWFALRGRAMPGPDQRAQRCIGTLCDVTGTRRAQDQLLSDAVYDRVSGLPNRALLVDRIERAIALSGDTPPGTLNVLVIDLDRFKAVNDGLGHESGDRLLRMIGRRLAAIAAENDTVARLPGDQFAILFDGDRPKRDILPFSDQLRAVIAKPINLSGQEIFLTASVGVATYREVGQNAEGLIKDASIALYEAKRRGKDTVEFFRAAMRDDRTELVALESELRRAVERGEIEVFYQPIARLADMELAGFEALVRWRHRTLGLLGPENFIGLAETTGIIKDIGRQVLNEAARQLGIWQRTYRARDPLFVSVNVSSTQILGADLLDDVTALLARENLVRDTLKLEITESIVMENPELAVTILERLKQIGIGLACDDFGTGYSSLSNLRRLPFDTLKVDRSFVEPEAEDAKAAVILESIIMLAHDLGLNIVAEGIQSQEDVDRLGALDCDFGQGYFIGEPMSAKQVVDVLSGIPYSATHDQTTIATMWERMGGASTGVTEEMHAPPVKPIAERQIVAEEAHKPARAQNGREQVATTKKPSKRPPPSLGKAPLAPRRSVAAVEPAIEKRDEETVVEEPAGEAAPPEKSADNADAGKPSPELPAEQPAKQATEPSVEDISDDEAEDAEDRPANGNGGSESPRDSEATARLAMKLRRKGSRKEQPPASN